MLLIRPQSFIDESLSSWRQRAGMENGFRRYPRMIGKHQARDPDRLHGADELHWLSNELAVTPAYLMSRTLDHLVSRVTGTRMRSAKHHWILPLGHPSKPSLSGPVYCPACLKSDEIPYARISWRLAFLSTCSIHGVSLHDRCPSCKALVWPASVHSISSNSWLTLRYCQKCEQDLSTHTAPDIDTDLRTSNQLWDCLIRGDASTITGKHFKSTEMFNALWAVCQLIMRRQSSHIRQLLPPFQCSDNTKKMIQGPTIELTPLISRRRIVASAAWMLEDWPHRFIDIVKQANISSAHMLATKEAQPYWMSEIIEQHLTLKLRNRITNTEVENAMHHLRSKNTPITKSAVRKLFDVTENKVINTYLNQRRQASEKELIKIIAMFEQALSISSYKKSGRDSLLRDYLIFLISILDRKDIATVCSMSEKEIYQFRSKDLPAISSQQYGILMRAKELADIYAFEIRPVFLKSNTSFSWFLSRFGMPIKEHSIRRRLTRMMESNFSKDLWRSADVFKGVF